MPRIRFLRPVLQGTRPPNPVVPRPVDTHGPPQKRPAGVPDPSKASTHMQNLLQKYEESVANDTAHFAIGGDQQYFPWAPITLLRPSARMTPFQAQFQVPRHWNKLDLRDYLWHLYGLRALNITTQIKWSRWVRGRTRYRTAQVKKMIIDMEEPFIWPSPDASAEETHQKTANLNMTKYQQELQDRTGSDLKKPADAYDGVLGPYPDAPQPFVPNKVNRRMANSKEKQNALERRKADEELIKQFLKL